MNAFEAIIENLNKQDFPAIEESAQELNATWNKISKYFNKINKAIKIYEETGQDPKIDLSNWEESDDNDEIDSDVENLGKKDFSKENINPVENDQTSISRSSRPRRNAFKEATQSIKNSVVGGGTIKKEKMSITNQNNEEMPAPARPAPRKKRPKKSQMDIKIKQEKLDAEMEQNAQLESHDSDIIIIGETTVPVINLSDSDDNEKTLKNENNKSEPTKKQNKKRPRTPLSDESKTENSDKRPKSDQPANITTETNYEDANSHLELPTENVNNATFVTEKKIDKNLPSTSAAMNETVVVSNPKFTPAAIDDLLTDDESEDEKKKKNTLMKTVTKFPSKSTKPIFNPFEQSPVKKKIQAFEKLGEENNAIPVRITRTKTKAQAKEQEEKDSKQVQPKTVVKEKANYFTPASSRFIPSAASTTLKTNKLATPNASNDSLSTTKLGSALKVSQFEYKQREKQRKEKEEIALKKREALIQAQIEEKKKKREEKQLKAQQQREALEKEKLKALEAQRLKDERHKQLIAEQEEKKQKHKEETEKKRLMAKMRAIEEKKKEEERRMEELKKAEEISAKLAKQDEEMARLVQKQKIQRAKIPIYLRTKARYLPTPDCFDSDDEEHENTHGTYSTWDKKVNLIGMEILTLGVSEGHKNCYFSRQAQTPDLVDIFEVIEPQKLKRSSSAVWHKPPRYTMIPNLEEFEESIDE